MRSDCDSNLHVYTHMTFLSWHHGTYLTAKDGTAPSSGVIISSSRGVYLTRY